jgi:hypothetical protein
MYNSVCGTAHVRKKKKKSDHTHTHTEDTHRHPRQLRTPQKPVTQLPGKDPGSRDEEETVPCKDLSVPSAF